MHFRLVSKKYPSASLGVAPNRCLWRRERTLGTYMGTIRVLVFKRGATSSSPERSVIKP